MKKQIILLFIMEIYSCSVRANTSEWELGTITTATTGRYARADAIDSQMGIGLRLNAENDQKWGVAIGVLDTNIDMSNSSGLPKQNQKNWLFSMHNNKPSSYYPGHWVLQLDTHWIESSDKVSDGVQAIAPKLAWFSHSYPIKFEISHAASRYRDTPTVQQNSISLGVGLNNQRNWLEIQRTHIYGLSRSNALGLDKTKATDLLFTQKIHNTPNEFVPNTLTLGRQFGQRIYNVDMNSQLVYNLPMLNKGGVSVSTSWLFDSKNEIRFHISHTNYEAQYPSTHEFTLNTFTFQYLAPW